MDTEPRWLTPEQLDAWRHLTGVLMLLPGQLDEPLREHGVSFFEYSIMAGLSSSPGRTRPMKDLANASNGSLSRLSHAVKRLEARGWVSRCASDEDGRVTLAHLTNEGQRLMERAAPDHVASVRRLVFDHLSPDLVASLREIGQTVTRPLYGGPPPWEHETT